MPIKCRVIDAGARYGLHPSWESLSNFAEFHLFEPDLEEARRLSQKYEGQTNISIHAKALYSHSTNLKFRVSRHRALNSILPANTSLLKQQSYKLAEFDTLDTFEVEAVSLDDYYRDAPIHFLKLDVEGAELDVLRGATNQLEKSILGVRSEVLFAEIYQGCPLFGDINKFLIDQGFELLNLDYDGKGAAMSPYAYPNKYGRLISTDGVWVKPFSNIFSSNAGNVAENVILMAIFLLENCAADVCVSLLLNAVEGEGIDISIFSGDPMYRHLRYKIATHFKSLSYIPSIDFEKLCSTYLKIFGHEFPRLNDFYQFEW